MKIYAISDLHLSNSVDKPMQIFGNVWHDHWTKIIEYWQSIVSQDDLVIIGGDISWAMKFEDAICDLKEIDSLNGKKIIIKGNHDYWWLSNNKLLAHSQEFPSLTFLKNDAVKIGNTIFCGSRGWLLMDSSEFKTDDMKIFKREVLRAKISLEKAKALQTDNEELIFIAHFPPINDSYTSNELTELLRFYNVKKVVFGHIHRDKQKYLIKNTADGITYYLTSCDLLNNKLIEILD